MFKWITKKDLIYWFIFILMIYVLGSDIGQADKLILDNWTFAGTIVSIILAVIAIIYTFDQSSLTVSSSTELKKSAKRVEEATLKLESSNIDSIINNLENKITELVTDVQVEIDAKLSIHHQDLKIMLNGSQTVTPFNDTLSNLSKNQWKTYIMTHLSIKQIDIEGTLLLHLYYKRKLSLDYNLNEITTWLLEASKTDLTDGNVTSNHLLMNGILRVYRSFGMVDYIEENSKLNITYFNETLYETLGTLIQELEEIGVVKSLREKLQNI